MKRIWSFFIVFATVMSLCAQPKHELRAVWLTTIGGLDFPSTYAHDGMGISRQQQELCQMLDRLQAINVNTVLFHTRIRATTSYPSDIEPWAACYSGQPGVWPGYDVLQFAIDECHRRGMELHAWVVTIPIGKWNETGCQQLRRHHPSMLRRIGEEGFMNPEQPQTADYLANICGEITRRYDIDGIHLDYIRYPEQWPLAKSSQERAVRRRHITRIVERIHDEVKRLKPWVKLSCSPVGKYDDLSRYSAKGWTAYIRVSQEAQNWLRDGLMDQLYPMMYFAGNQFFPFAIDWAEHAEGRSVAAGLGIYQLHPKERNWQLGEVKRQLNVSRSLGMGHCYFRAKFLLDNVKGIYDYMRHFDNHPALIPPMTWASSIPPTPPATIDVKRSTQGDHVSWSGARDNSNGPYLLYNIYASTGEPVDVSKAENLIATRYRQHHITLRRTAGKPLLHYAVTALDRYGNESAPIRSHEVKHEGQPYRTALLTNDGRTLALPPVSRLLDAQRLVVSDLQGRAVQSNPYRQNVDISTLPEGMYLLTAVNRRGHSHRLGHFIIRRKTTH